MTWVLDGYIESCTDDMKINERILEEKRRLTGRWEKKEVFLECEKDCAQSTENTVMKMALNNPV